VLEYTRWAFSSEEDVDFWFGDPITDADRAAVEYWAVILDQHGKTSTLAGTVVLRFAADGRVSEHRDYWRSKKGVAHPTTAGATGSRVKDRDSARSCHVPVTVLAVWCPPWQQRRHLGKGNSPRRGVAPQQQAGKRFASLVQLLETPKGETLVRFAYSTGGTARRGPVTFRNRDLERLRRALDGAPRLQEALLGASPSAPR